MNSYDILCIDDEQIVLDLLEAVLRGEGWQSRLYLSGQDALAAMRQKKPSLVLLDMMMPGMDGFAVLKEIKQDAQLKDLNVVFLTASADPESVAKYIQMGAAGVVSKPIAAEDLPYQLSLFLKRSA